LVKNCKFNWSIFIFTKKTWLLFFSWTKYFQKRYLIINAASYL
jgi:hypothetical protein